MSYIAGEGPKPCPTILIGEQPGFEEVRYSRVFIGKAGRELDRYLNGYTLPNRRDLFLTNLKREQAPKGEFPVAQWELDALWAEIRQVQPTTIVTLGAHVTRYFCGEQATLEAYHGIPHPPRPELDLPGVVTFPTYNPAAMLHSPGLQAAFSYDMKRLGLYLKGKLEPAPVDIPNPCYTKLTGREEVRCVLVRS